MALYIKPKVDPREFLQVLVNATMHGSERRVPDWILTSQNVDFALATGDAAVDLKAYLRPEVTDNGQLVLHFHWREGHPPDATVYAAYHARFVEMLLTYFHPACELISVA